MTLEGFDGPWEPRSLSQSFLVATAQKTKDPDAPITRSFTIERKTNGRIFMR